MEYLVINRVARVINSTSIKGIDRKYGIIICNMTTKKKAVKKTVKKAVKTFDPKRLPNIIPTYTMTLKYGDKIYTESSDDITEAILGLKPDRINNRTVFTLEYNGKKAEVMKSVPRAKRILTNRLAATLLGKYMFMRLK